jgi:hypothetical protein
MIEVFIIVAVIFFIAVLFYKQANEQFEISQITAARLEELPTLYAERSPIVVSGYPLPGIGTEGELRKRPRILQMKVGQTTLQHLLDSPRALANFQFPYATAEFLAQESGLTVWFQHHLYDQLLPSPYTKWFYSAKTTLWLHHRGLFPTTAFQTLIMPTQGVARVSLMLATALPYLPTRWEGRQFMTLSAQDTPLLGQIKYIDVLLRPGTLLLLPPHMIVDIASSDSAGEAAWLFVAEIHHPISRLA